MVTLYERDKRLDDARRILLKFAKVDSAISATSSTRPATSNRCGCNAMGTAAVRLHELGFAADAVSLYSQALALAREIPAGGPMYYGNTEGMLRQYRDGLTRAMEDLRPEALAASMLGLVDAVGSSGPPRTPALKAPESQERRGRPQIERRRSTAGPDGDGPSPRARQGDRCAAFWPMRSPRPRRHRRRQTRTS